MYFTYFDGSLQIHETPEEAKAEAESIFDYIACASCDDGWDAEADNLYWGEVWGSVRTVSDEQATEEQQEMGFDRIVEKKLIQEGMDGFEALTYSACLTGDCPHETANDCLAALTAEIEQLAKRTNSADCGGDYYLLQNVHAGFVGNSPLWWKKGGSGYTGHVDDAERFTSIESQQKVREGAGKYVAYLERDVLANSYLMADIQGLRRIAEATKEK